MILQTGVLDVPKGQIKHLNGLGAWVCDSANNCFEADDYGTTSSGGSSWSAINNLITGGLDIVKQVTLPTGTVIQTPQGTMIRQSDGLPVPALATNFGLNTSTSGMGGLLLLGGAAILAVALFSRR